MADFTTANLEGANELFNKTATDAKALKDQLVAQHGADASTMKTAVESKVADLQTSLSSMIPELPTVPNVNMQGEFAGLADIDISTPQGLEQYKAQVSNIESQFGTAMKDKGLDIFVVPSNSVVVAELAPIFIVLLAGVVPFEKIFTPPLRVGLSAIFTYPVKFRL